MGDEAWWSEPLEATFVRLGSGPDGLSGAAAADRIPPASRSGRRHETQRLFVGQFANPLVLILIFAAILSLVLKEWVDAAIILAIVAGSGVLGFSREYAASRAIADLRARLVRQVRVLRDGTETRIDYDKVVPGDVALLKAGDLVPGDGLVIEATALSADEAALTGEAYPAEKAPGPSPADAQVSERHGALFAGTSIRSGSGRMLVVTTGRKTLFGGIEQQLEQAEQQTEFARGLDGFGAMLMRVMLAVVALVLVATQLFGHPLVDSLLFAMALAVAISPELLPAIVSVTLAAGAKRMTAHGVLVRRLQAIENLGGIDVLCTDKTGTLTRGAIALSAAVDPRGEASDEVLHLAAANAALQTAMDSPLDAAVLAAAQAASIEFGDLKKLREEPYDFAKRRYAVEARLGDGRAMWITKGAVREVLSSCSTVRGNGSTSPLDDAARDALDAFVAEKAGEGFRALALSTGREGEACFEGFLLFFDPPKPGIDKTVAALQRRGISVRIISGDNRHVSVHMAHLVGLSPGEVLTGADIAALPDAELVARVGTARVFAEVEPQQKERIVRAFQSAGHAVGYMGDGINDAPALKAADVGISVDSAVDVARESADIVLLRPDLDAIRRGVEDGRRTFANTLKYVAITTSANFGNMVSMAAATLFLPFLPLLPVQILLNNFLSDLPAIAIAGDAVDRERLVSAQRWNIGRIRGFMIRFGLISSVFDMATFAWLWFVTRADPELFRTGWFVVSLLTEIAVLLVLRTRRRFWRSRPSPLLLAGSLLVAALTLALPYSGPIAALFQLQPLAPGLLAVLFGIVLLYAATTELAKHRHGLQGD